MRIEASVREAIPELFPEGPLTTAPGTVVEGPASITVRCMGAEEFRGVDIASILHFAVDVATDVPGMVTADLIARWLIRMFRGRATSLTIKRHGVDLNDEGQVRRIVDEDIRYTS